MALLSDEELDKMAMGIPSKEEIRRGFGLPPTTFSGYDLDLAPRESFESRMSPPTTIHFARDQANSSMSGQSNDTQRDGLEGLLKELLNGFDKGHVTSITFDRQIDYEPSLRDLNQPLIAQSYGGERWTIKPIFGPTPLDEEHCKGCDENVYRVQRYPNHDAIKWLLDAGVLEKMEVVCDHMDERTE